MPEAAHIYAIKRRIEKEMIVKNALPFSHAAAIFFACAILLAGIDNAVAQTAPATETTVNARLYLIRPPSPDNSNEAILKQLNEAAPPYATKDRNFVLKACGALASGVSIESVPPAPTATSVTPVAGFFGSIISIVFDYAESWLSSQVQDALKKYSAGYQAITPGNFYLAPSSIEKPKFVDLTQNIQCIRVFRPLGPNAILETSNFDFVGLVQFSTDHQFFKVCPLSIFLGNSLAQSADSSRSASVELIGNSTWIGVNQGYQQQVFDTTIVSEKFETARIAKYYFDDKGNVTSCDKEAKIVFPPASIEADGSIRYDTKTRHTGAIDLTAKIAEVGKTPELLNIAAELLKAEGPSLSKAIAAAVNSEAGLSSSGGQTASGGG
jgi:hypothetical protein